jgi:ElaB/YqjD/DUF883 family membrane-anchored ribosome-binding protein
MPSSTEPSIEELRGQSELTREALASTVGELRNKVSDAATEVKTIVSPAHVKQEFKEYIRQERDTFAKSLKRKAEENPLQLAAIGAAVAYPAWGLLRSIPTPLLLIGAGLFLTSKRGHETAKQMSAQIEDVVQQGTASMSDAVTSIKSDLQDRVADARRGAEEISGSMSSAAASAADKVRAAVHDTTDKLKSAAKDALGQMTALAEDATTEVASSTDTFSEGAAEMAARGRRSVTDFVSENSLLVAGISAAVGAFIAASIPASEAENRLFGAGSEKLKNKAREAAAEGIERAGDIAVDAAGSVAAAAAREGLDAAGVRQALNTVAESVRNVAERGLDTALGQNFNSGEKPVSERNPT